MKILLVEDDQDIANNLEYLLEQENYQVEISSNYQDEKNKIYHNEYDLYILDISLPDGNGNQLYQKLIKDLEKPTIFLTAKDEEETIVSCLESGAEDYITKPFSSKELLVRIKKIIARYKKNNLIKVKDITFDLDKMVVFKNGDIINLTSLELKIFYLLISQINKVVTRESIIENIWDWTGNDVNDNTVTVYLKRIREKLDSDIITTVKGIGYRIDYHEE